MIRALYLLASTLFISISLLGCNNSDNDGPAAAKELALKTESDSISFLAFGDSGTGKQGQFQLADTMRALCNSVPCDFAVLLGDNIYESGVDSVDDQQFYNKFERPYKDVGFPIFLVLGNHDYKGNIQAQIDYSDHSDLWHMPARYYTMNVPEIADKEIDPLTLIGLDTNIYHDEPEQQEWLAQQLADATTPWKVAFGHHPIYSYGDHGGEEELIESLMPVLCDQAADLYLAGHEHDLQLLRSDCETDLIISGAAGKLRKTGKGDRTEFAKSIFGFAYIRVSMRRLTVHFIDVTGQIIHTKEYKK